MSYCLADSTGYLTDFASIGGLADFAQWAQQQAAPIRRFVQRGWTEDLMQLYDSLNEAVADDPDIESALSLLAESAEHAQDVLILNDGTSNEEEPEARDLRTASQSQLHTAADTVAPKIQVAVSYAFAMGRKAVKLSALQNATSLAEAKVAIAGVPKAVEDALLKVLPNTLLGALSAGGEASSFDLDLKRAQAWVHAYSATLAEQLAETTKNNLDSVIATQFEQRWSLHTLASWIDDALQAVGDIARAQRIADTESMRMVNQGVLQSFKQAVEDGYLTGKEKKEWITQPGCCDECDELDGEEVFMDEDFSSGDDAPPLHPNCRCTLSTSI